MDNKLYKMMNWPEIESIIYSECDHPHEILGKHSVQAGSLIQAFFPGAAACSISILSSGLTFDMELADDEGFFAYWTNDKDIPEYEYIVSYEDGSKKRFAECYNVLPKPDKAVFEKLYAGVLYDMYDHFGAKETDVKGIRGTLFTVYAPMAERVSVVSDFNGWDGRISQMSRIGENGVFSIFVPRLPAGTLYKYEIKLRSGLTYLKRDPFAREIEYGRGTACVVPENDYFSWSDTKFLTTYKGFKDHDKPFLLGDLDFRDFYEMGMADSVFSEKLVRFIKDKRYTAVSLNNLSMFSNKENCEKGVLSLFALSNEDMSVTTVKKAVNSIHENGIPVFFTIDLSSFIPDQEGLKGFDGRKLYEAEDDCETAGLITFNFNNKYVRNYLISAAFFYVKNFHADGLVIKGTDRIRYLSYGHTDGDYATNMFGGPENPGGEELLKHLNSILHKKHPEIVTIAADSYYSNDLTKIPEEGGFGFDFKLSNNFHTMLTAYMSNDPMVRCVHHSELTNMVLNAYCEEFFLCLPRETYGTDEFRMCEFMPGPFEEKVREIKLVLCTLFFGPDKKSIPFYDFNDPGLDELMKALIDLYFEEKALYEYDNSREGFEWIDAIDSEHSTVSFKRKGKLEELIVIGNFSNYEHEVNLNLEDKTSYIEILDTEEKRFGGKHNLSSKAFKVTAKKDDPRPKLSVKMAPLSFKLLKKML